MLGWLASTDGTWEYQSLSAEASLESGTVPYSGRMNGLSPKPFDSSHW